MVSVTRIALLDSLPLTLPPHCSSPQPLLLSHRNRTRRAALHAWEGHNPRVPCPTSTARVRSSTAHRPSPSRLAWTTPGQCQSCSGREARQSRHLIGTSLATPRAQVKDACDTPLHCSCGCPLRASNDGSSLTFTYPHSHAITHSPARCVTPLCRPTTQRPWRRQAINGAPRTRRLAVDKRGPFMARWPWLRRLHSCPRLILHLQPPHRPQGRLAAAATDAAAPSSDRDEQPGRARAKVCGDEFIRQSAQMARCGLKRSAKHENCRRCLALPRLLCSFMTTLLTFSRWLPPP